jgi:hypothetical protein
VIGAEVGQASITPLYSRLYSQHSPDFRSENAEIKRALDTVCEHTGRRGIWVLDRGGDRGNIIYPLLERKRRFIIRLVGDRNVVYRGNKQVAVELALRCPVPYQERVVKDEGGKEKLYQLAFGYRTVRFPGRNERLSLVVVRGLGQVPMMLLSDVQVRNTRSSVWSIVESYLTRWRIEETIRFIKQSYQLEDIRLLSYGRLQNMMALILAVAYFTMVYLGLRTKLRVLAAHVLTAARRLFGVPDFRFYALADGIREFLFNPRKGFQNINPMSKTHHFQMSLFDP